MLRRFNVLLVILIVGTFSFGPSVSAATPETYWVRDPATDAVLYQIDARCLDGKPDPVEVWLFTHEDFKGQQLRLCRYVNHLGKFLLSPNNFDTNWNDRLSSFKIVYLKTGECMRLWEHALLQGNSHTYGSTGWYSSMPSGWNDYVSSLNTPC